jgi:hypothetical protein
MRQPGIDRPICDRDAIDRAFAARATSHGGGA